MGKLDDATILKLNKNWISIAARSSHGCARNVLPDMVTGVVTALNVDYENNEDGSYNFEKIESVAPTPWEEWVNLPIRNFEHGVRTRHHYIRIPFVVVCSNYDKIPIRRVLFPTKKNIFDRDDLTCCYSGLKLDRKTSTIDHIVPSSKGGGDCWSNLVTCHKEINHWKSDQLLEECLIENITLKDPKLLHWQKQHPKGSRLELINLPKKPKNNVLVMDRVLPQWKAFVGM